LAEIATGDAPRRRAARMRRASRTEPSEDGTPAGRPAGALAFVPLMKALGVMSVPSGAWRCEIKYDGYRALAGVVRGQRPHLWSRNEKSLAADYPEIVAALAKVKCRDALLDGEIVALDAEGRSRFQLLQQRSAAGARPPIAFYIFDLLRLDGVDLTSEPLERRRAVLDRLLADPPDPLRLSPAFEVEPAQLLAEAGRLGLEGIVAKAAGSLYEAGRRSGAWLKCRIASEQEFVIGGFTPPEGGRTHLGALLVGHYDGSRLLYAGKVGTGFSDRTLAELAGLLEPLRQEACPFANLPSAKRSRFGAPMNSAALRHIRWVRPVLVCQVKFSEWTDDGRLRHPVYLGLRKDKRAEEVVREAPGVKASAGARARGRTGRRASARGPAPRRARSAASRGRT
ncbi:MAG TPA: non-homologous end-joining DNA ligase, partial [Opitutaceae bacterium]|nr:non-homologous end-joining DNA ligase [Opitutaceae bacterium]